MNSIDLSPEALTRLKTLAQEATPGPWYMDGATTICPPHNYKKELVKSQMGAMGVYLPSIAYCNQKADAAYIAAAHPGVILAMCEEIERLRAQVATQEVLSGEDDACMTQLEVERDALEEQVGRLEKEADWLALVLANACCGIPLSEFIDMDSNGMSPPGPEHWREAAFKASE